MLETVLLEQDSSASNELIICMYCEKNVKKRFEFKKSCLHTEDFINFFSTRKNSDKLDLTEIFLNKTENKDGIILVEGHTVCRLCMELVKHDCCIPLCGDSKGAVFFSLYFPEINLKITTRPVICVLCHSSLQDYFHFMSSIAEKIVQRTRAGERADRDDRHTINLELELKDSVKYENDYVAKECQEEIDQIGLKREQVVNTETEKFYLKPEPVHDELKSVDCDSTCPPQLESCMPQSANKTYDCPLCGLKTKTKYNLRRHVKLHHQDPTKLMYYECTTCPFKTKYKGSFKKHINSIHQNDAETTMYQCDVCSLKTKYKYVLRRHMLVHQDDSQVSMYHCDHCEFKTKHKISLRKHFLSHKGVETSWHQCEICPFKSKLQKRFDNHMRFHKNNLTPTVHRCDMCEYETVVKGNFNRHLSCHRDSSEVKMYQCEKCEHKTRRKHDLKVHMLVHQKCVVVSTYKCEFCQYQANYKQSLSRHMLSQHKAAKVS